MTADVRSPVLPEASLLGPLSYNWDLHGRGLLCPLHVDSTRIAPCRVCANSGHSTAIRRTSDLTGSGGSWRLRDARRQRHCLERRRGGTPAKRLPVTRAWHHILTGGWPFEITTDLGASFFLRCRDQFCRFSIRGRQGDFKRIADRHSRRERSYEGVSGAVSACDGDFDA
jgi:hypothetical protein